nr:histidine kinase N-terminal 7TM domain-containing protein [uncultured Ruminococcus sp.]
MVRKVDKTKLLTVVGIIIFLFGGAVRIFSHLTSSADNYIENFDVIIFSGLIIGWGVSVAYRIVQKNIRICLVISAALMLLWMALRAIKYNSPADINTYGRYLWYSYYIAMVFLPLMMFFAMLNIGKPENTNNRKYLLIIPAAVLVLLVMTNDFHQLAFVFEPDFHNWNKQYSYGPVYYVIAVWIFILVLSSIVLSINRCRISATRKKLWIPIVIILVAIIYTLWNNLNHGYSGLRIYNVPEVFCFASIALWESLIQIGLVPSNTGYGDFFNASNLNTLIFDNKGNVKYRSKNATNVSKDVVLQNGNSVVIDENIILKKHNIKGGKAVWTEDISAINRINRELSEVKEQISEYNVILKSEAELKKRRAAVTEQNKLYDSITEFIRPQLCDLENILKNIENNRGDIAVNYAGACVVNVYIKRISNLLIMAKSRKMLNAFELENSIRELAEYISVCGISCSFFSNVSGEISAEKTIALFKFIGIFIRRIMNCTDALLFNLKVHDRFIDLKINCDSKNEMKIPDDLLDDIIKLGGNVTTEYDADTLFVFVRMQSGGDDI